MRSKIALFLIASQAFAFGASAQDAPPPPLLPEEAPAAEAKTAPATSEATPMADEDDGLPADVDASAPVTTATPQQPPADGATAPPSRSVEPRRQRRQNRAAEIITLTQREGGVARELTIDDVDWTLWTGAGFFAGTAAMGIATAIGAIVGGAVAADLGERKRNGEQGVYQAQQAKGVADVVTGLFAFASVATLTLAAVFSGVGFHRLEEAKWTTGASAGNAAAPETALPPASTAKEAPAAAPTSDANARAKESVAPSDSATGGRARNAVVIGSRASESNESESAKNDDDTGSPSSEVAQPSPPSRDNATTPTAP